MSQPGVIDEIYNGYVVLCRTDCGSREEFSANDMQSFGSGLRQRGWITINGYWHCPDCEDGRQG